MKILVIELILLWNHRNQNQLSSLDIINELSTLNDLSYVYENDETFANFIDALDEDELDTFMTDLNHFEQRKANLENDFNIAYKQDDMEHEQCDHGCVFKL